MAEISLLPTELFSEAWPTIYPLIKADYEELLSAAPSRIEKKAENKKEKKDKKDKKSDIVETPSLTKLRTVMEEVQGTKRGPQ